MLPIARYVHEIEIIDDGRAPPCVSPKYVIAQMLEPDTGFVTCLQLTEVVARLHALQTWRHCSRETALAHTTIMKEAFCTQLGQVQDVLHRINYTSASGAGQGDPPDTFHIQLKGEFHSMGAEGCLCYNKE